MATRTVPVTDLYVRCMLQVRNFDRGGVAASDCCQAPAQSAVDVGRGHWMWRCFEHEGVVALQTHGKIWHTIERIVKDD